MSLLKNQILRIAPTFKEKDCAATTFSELLGRCSGQIEVKGNRARLR